MSFLKKTIFTGFAPNLVGSDVAISLSYLLLPWQWPKINQGAKVVLAEQKIKEYFKVDYCHAFDSGRSALFFALKALDIEAGDEVLLQAYTCMVVSNAINWAGAKPVYVDINSDLNMDPEDLLKKLTPKSKVLVIQHTFGLSADLDRLMAIAKQHNLLVIEDCAHSFGAEYKGKLTGTFGDLSLLSFGADKVLSSARGGALITNDRQLSLKLKAFQDELPEPKLLKTIQHLLHFPIFFIGKKLYGIQIGKAMLALAKKYNLMNRVIYSAEKRGQQVDFYPSKYANALAAVLLNQLVKIDEVNEHRKEIARIYNEKINSSQIELPWRGSQNTDEGCIFLRYPVLADNPKILLAKAKREKIILGNWYDAVIAPADADINKSGYIKGSCPKAEDLASRSLNLPTNRHITVKDAERVCKFINNAL